MAGASLLLGVLVLFGWHTHNSALIQVAPHFAPMQYNTALCFLFCGAGLAAIIYGRKMPALLLSAVVFFISFATLLQYIFNADFGIDQALMEHYVITKSSHPGRMAPNTALCFSLVAISISLLVFSDKRQSALIGSETLGLVTLALSIIAISGYLAGVEKSYGWAGLTRMAVHTAAGFIILGVGIIAAVWRMRNSPVDSVPLWASSFLCLGIVLFDLRHPLGVAAAVAYIPLVFCSLWFQRRDAAFYFALLASVLTILGYFASADIGATDIYVLMNRGLSLIGIWVTAVSVFLLKRTQEIATHHKHELELIFHNVPARIWFKDSENKILRANRQAADSMGISVEEAEGADTYELFPEIAKKYHDDDLAVINSGKPALGIIEEYSPRDNQHGWVRTDKIPYKDPALNDDYVLVMSIDVTKEKEAEEALRLSEERFALAADGSSAGIWDWIDVTQNAEWWSPIFYELIGYKPDELDSTLENFRLLLHPEDRDRTFELVQSHFENHTPYKTEFRLRHKTKGYRWFLASGQACWDDNGAPTRMCGSIIDIQELKLSQKALERQALRLERANKELDHFAYVASHDLRAPLRGMDNMAQWVLDDLGDNAEEGITEKLTLLRGRVARMNQLLTDILAYSRAGKRESAPEKVDCNVLVTEITGWLELPEEFSVTVKQQLPTVMIQRTLLEQTFTNLITNAVKHHDRSAGVVTIDYSEQADHLEFIISDDGPGIPEKFQERIFQMFQTLKPRDQVEGSGIGLAIVKKMIESMGGALWVRSPIDERGTAFHFTVPKKESESLIEEEVCNDPGKASQLAAG